MFWISHLVVVYNDLDFCVYKSIASHWNYFSTQLELQLHIHFPTQTLHTSEEIRKMQLSALLTLLPLALGLTVPGEERAAAPLAFEGQGQLMVTDWSHIDIGCLITTGEYTADFSKCATFTGFKKFTRKIFPLPVSQTKKVKRRNKADGFISWNTTWMGRIRNNLLVYKQYSWLLRCTDSWSLSGC